MHPYRVHFFVNQQKQSLKAKCKLPIYLVICLGMVPNQRNENVERGYENDKEKIGFAGTH
jgi:hypothetical protein